MTATTTRPTPTHRRADQTSRLWHLLIVVMLWIAYTFIRGALVGWYPYPFLDVEEIGSWASIRNTAFVLVVAVVWWRSSRDSTGAAPGYSKVRYSWFDGRSRGSAPR
jgi:hypothetical protein